MGRGAVDVNLSELEERIKTKTAELKQIDDTLRQAAHEALAAKQPQLDPAELQAQREADAKVAEAKAAITENERAIEQLAQQEAATHEEFKAASLRVHDTDGKVKKSKLTELADKLGSIDLDRRYRESLKEPLAQRLRAAQAARAHLDAVARASRLRALAAELREHGARLDEGITAERINALKACVDAIHLLGHGHPSGGLLKSNLKMAVRSVFAGTFLNGEFGLVPSPSQRHSFSQLTASWAAHIEAATTKVLGVAVKSEAA